MGFALNRFSLLERTLYCQVLFTDLDSEYEMPPARAVLVGKE
jgi:hypothetical protein